MSYSLLDWVEIWQIFIPRRLELFKTHHCAVVCGIYEVGVLKRTQKPYYCDICNFWNFAVYTEKLSSFEDYLERVFILKGIFQCRYRGKMLKCLKRWTKVDFISSIGHFIFTGVSTNIKLYNQYNNSTNCWILCSILR